MARTAFTEEELELARKAQRDYYRKRKLERRASNVRYWIKKAKEAQERENNVTEETVTG
ncbi:MAG TPA: phosphatase [Thermotogota bacterium]|nr:phosphatase [Thermotogota bacterium]